MICIIDYGAGNLKSIENAVKFYYPDIRVDIVREPERLKNYSKIIFPGVGAFGNAVQKIQKLGFDSAILEEAGKGSFILGICLGMQLFATKSYEYGEHNGLDLIEGEVVHFKDVMKDLSVPHMGWNDVEFVKEDRIFHNIKGNSDFYFVHSYYFRCKKGSDILGVTQYGINFPSVINRDNIYGVQFHPEKSQESGLLFIKNFIEL